MSARFLLTHLNPPHLLDKQICLFPRLTAALYYFLANQMAKKKQNYCPVDLDISPTNLCLKWDCDPLVSLTTVAMSLQMFDSHNYRTRPDVLWCCFLSRNNSNMCLLSCYFLSLMEIIPVQHLFDGRLEVITRHWVYVWNALKCLPERLRTHLHHHWAAPVENTCLFPIMYFNYLSDLGRYCCSRTERQADVCQVLWKCQKKKKKLHTHRRGPLGMSARHKQQKEHNKEKECPQHQMSSTL